MDKPPEEKTPENCHRLGHVYVQTAGNLAKCALCGHVIYREVIQRGVKAIYESN